MDDEVRTVNPVTAFRHNKWSLIALAVDLAHGIAQEVASTLEAATAVAMQHRQHKIEEERFHEIVGD